MIRLSKRTNFTYFTVTVFSISLSLVYDTTLLFLELYIVAIGGYVCGNISILHQQDKVLRVI